MYIYLCIYILYISIIFNCRCTQLIGTKKEIYYIFIKHRLSLQISKLRCDFKNILLNGETEGNSDRNFSQFR